MKLFRMCRLSFRQNGSTFRYAAAAILVISIVFTGLSASAEGQKRPFVTPEKRISDLEKEVQLLRREVNPYSLDLLPESVIVIDKKVSIFRDDVRERFERELYSFLENRGIMLIVMKRYFKYYQTINEEIQRSGAHKDLMYLVIVESFLNPRAVSRAKAAGLWQFIQETGKREGLSITDHIDERFNIKKSTRSAIAHLKRLHSEFGDWFIAMAAYNAGAGRLKEVISNQGTKDFLEMYLPEETERYVFRIMALKEIIENREKYGFVLFERDLYRPLSIAEVTIEIHKEVHSNLLQACMGVSYKTFRDYNLHIRRYRIPVGTYHISMPSDKKEIFLKRIREHDYIRAVKTD